MLFLWTSDCKIRFLNDVEILKIAKSLKIQKISNSASLLFPYYDNLKYMLEEIKLVK